MELLAACAEGKNVYTEIKCTSLLPLEDVVRVVTHEDCITEVLSVSSFIFSAIFEGLPLFYTHSFMK